MMGAHVFALAAAHGQDWSRVGELLLAFVLSSLIGLEREMRGKSAGLRTQAIVGTASALIMLISKYGFADVLSPGHVVLDPSRVAAQIVSGIGFLGAGLIITRHGALRGLTTAAAVWEVAAIGMAAGAGLWLLALVVTGLHFVIVVAYTPLVRRLPGPRQRMSRVTLTYEDGRGVLRSVLAVCTEQHWTITEMAAEAPRPSGDLPELVGGDASGVREVSVLLGLAGEGVDHRAVGVLAGVDGVLHVDRADSDAE